MVALDMYLLTTSGTLSICPTPGSSIPEFNNYDQEYMRTFSCALAFDGHAAAPQLMTCANVCTST